MAAGMGPWWALLLFLPQVLQGQNSTPPGSPGLKSFHSDQFQGEWFVLGLAGNAFKREDRELLNPFITNFEQKSNNQLEVFNSMTRGKRCDTWSYVLIPTAQPGKFIVDNQGENDMADSEDVQVMDTDYTNFALVLSLRHTSSRTISRVSLLGRSWRLPFGTLDKFFCLAQNQGLTKNNLMFPDETGWSPHLDGC
uniref:epididymal-specific lipocalin-12 n=1 Tax=Jaculus jaculus TaxID=51337 RepID=UPI001E1B04B2|nr:epididymal-specific lipocalin-12 [Jaculus jaculus]